MSHTFLVIRAGLGIAAFLLVFFGVKCYHRKPAYERLVASNGGTFLNLVPADVLQARLYMRMGKIFMVSGGALLIARLLHAL